MTQDKNIPTIETQNLILRSHQASDLEACAAMWASSEMVRYIGGKPSTRPESWRRILAYRGHWELMGFGYWAIEEKISKKYVGEVGFANFMRDIEPSLGNVPELGIILAPQFHGQGYAVEALGAILDWADSIKQWPETVALVSPENIASLKVCERMGYQETLRTQHMGLATVVLRRLMAKR